MNNLTDEQIRDLAKAQQMMDSGEVPFVMYGSDRVMMDAEIMAHFSLKQGQTITETIWRAILKFNIARCEAEIKIRKTPN